MKIIQLSDLHIMPPGKALYGKDPLWQLDLALQHIEQHHSDLNLMVITGDLTQFGDESSYQALKRRLKRLDWPVQLLIGNHDNRETFKEIFDHAEYEDEFAHRSFISHGLLHVLLDTHKINHDEGELCEKRIQWLEHTLRTHPHAPALLYMHHPPFDAGIAGMDRCKLSNPLTLLNALQANRGRVLHIFTGHLHRAMAGQWQGFSVSCCKSPNHQVSLNQADPVMVYGVDEPTQYVVAFVTPEQCVIHHQDYCNQAQTFSL
jgi:3',5'-cyclic-AMP phosphodiesterase